MLKKASGMAAVFVAMIVAEVSVSMAAQPPYPAKPIRLLLGFPPGGSADLAARLVMPEVGDSLKQQIIIDNRSGAHGNIAGELVAKAEPDGYTLLLGTFSSLAVNPALYKKPPFDPAKDFAPITTLASLMNVVVIHPSVSANSMKELIALAKARPGYFTYASSGQGSPGHLMGEVLKRIAQIEITHVPYKGGGPAMSDLLGGHVHMMMASVPTAVPYVKSGRLKALAVSSNQRSVGLPEVPTVFEATGLAGYEETQWYVRDWFGVLAPARTSRPIVDRLHAECVAALNRTDVREKLLARGLEPLSMTPDQFRTFLASEIAKWSKVAREAGVTVE